MTPRVLVVEDNRDLADNVQEIFEETGAEVEVRGDFAAAEAAARAGRYDLALVDVNLPAGANGLDLVPSIRETSPAGEVIVLTGSATLNSAIEAVRHGVFAYVPKPFDPQDLLRLSERALAQVRLRAERTALSRELARSEALHRAVLDTVDSLIVGVDTDGSVRLFNRAAEQVTGLDAEEVEGRAAVEVLAEEEDRDELRALLADPAAGREARIALVTADRERRAVRWTARPLASSAVEGPMVILSGADLTERLALQRRAADAEAMAALGRMTSALAHEIRNPLNAATLQLELLKRGARKLEAEPMERRARIVADELRRLGSLLDDFLGLARPTAVALTLVDAARLMHDVAQLHEPLVVEAGLVLEVALPEPSPAVHADASRLKQAVTNLVVNALDALRERGRGTIELAVESPDPETVCLIVKDDGPGLDKDPLDLLRPFVTTKQKGTGLGLPIVARIAEMHGGRLEIGPREGGGTRACLCLPRRFGAPT